MTSDSSRVHAGVRIMNACMNVNVMEVDFHTKFALHALRHLLKVEHCACAEVGDATVPAGYQGRGRSGVPRGRPPCICCLA